MVFSNVLLSFLPTFLGLVAFLYLVSPIIVKISNVVKASPTLERMDPAHWPPAVANEMRRHEHDLYNMGFEISERFSMTGAAPSVANLLTMFVDRKSGDKAMLTAIWALNNGVWKLTTIYLEFSTRFRDGRCFDTLNSQVPLGTFVRGPQDVKTQVPQIKDARELYRTHLYVMRQHGASGNAAEKVTFPPGGAENYLRRIWRESHDEQVKFGRYVYNQSKDVYTPSWKGAYLMTWRMLWPFSRVVRAKMNRNAQVLVAQMRQNAGESESTSLASRSVV